MTADTPDTIVLIHGFWVTPRSWEHWIDHYEQRGFRVLAPAYPGFEVEVEALNADPTPIEEVTVPAIIERLASVIRPIDPPPILIGHSAGGVFVQIMLDHGYGAVGVAINSAPTELLFLSGGEDHLMPPSVQRFERQALQVPDRDGGQGVPGACASHASPGRLGRGHGLRARLGYPTRPATAAGLIRTQGGPDQETRLASTHARGRGQIHVSGLVCRGRGPGHAHGAGQAVGAVGAITIRVLRVRQVRRVS